MEMDPWEEIIRKYEGFLLTYFAPAIENRQKSNKVEGITTLLRSLPLELKAKQLPPAYHHWPSSTWQNTKIRVDHIPKSVAACWSIAIRALVGETRTTRRVLELYSEDESNFFAFLTFPNHDYASRFVKIFNNKQIPGTNMLYQLSWAPFYQKFSILLDEHEHEDEDEDEEPHQELPAEYEKKKEEGKEGNVSMTAAEEFLRRLPVDNDMFSKLCAFHESLNKEAAIESEALWKRGMFDILGVMHGPDDGRTTILCLTVVDPCVKESFMKSIFEQYGECTVNLPDKEGCGIVKFEQRTCAENAFVDLATLLKDENVCCLQWGLDREERYRRFKQFGLRGLEREGLPAGYVSFADTSPLAMVPAASFADTSNYGKEKAIAGPQTSKRLTGAEMSKRFQSVRNSIGNTKAKRGRTNY